MDKGTGTIEVGFWVALSLKPNTAPLRCYIGQVQAIDKRGIRLTLMDWIIGQAVGDDFFAPWDSIVSILVCTPEHSLENFIKYGAPRWQTEMNGGKTKCHEK